jgi:hypothetical protein
LALQQSSGEACASKASRALAGAQTGAGLRSRTTVAAPLSPAAAGQASSGAASRKTNAFALLKWLTFALTRVQKGREAPLLRVGVERVVTPRD